MFKESFNEEGEMEWNMNEGRVQQQTKLYFK